MESINKSTVGEKVKEVVSMDIRLPVLSRLKKRVKEIQELSQAKIRKIPLGNTHMFETVPPKMFISNLEARMEGSNVGVISYQKYKMNGEDKAVVITKKTVNGKEIDIDAHYVIDKIVVERIEFMKPIKREEMSYEQ